MKNRIVILAILLFSLTVFTQEIQHEAIAVNIEVPVRIFKGKTFIDNLTIDDFEVYEDGILQTVEAVYFIRKTEIIKKEIKKAKNEKIENKVEEFVPNPSRNFVLMFEIVEYMPKIGDVLDYFFESVIAPGDSLIIATPMKTYNLNSEALSRMPRNEIANQLKGKIRKDSKQGNSEYRSLIGRIRNIDETAMPGMSKSAVVMQELRKLKNLTYFDVKKAKDFADFLKAKDGQKQIFFFFQKRTMPIPSYISDFDKMELKNDISFNSKELERAFSDSSITCNFLYITKAFRDGTGRVPSKMEQMVSAMESFRGFSEMADVTGGLKDSSANASASFERAVDYSESYYMLYYSPKDYKADGTFKKIKVKIRGQNYRITHRSGYVAD